MTILSSTALAQEPAPQGMSPAQAAARRFPQPVRVGNLLGEAVLQPVESQNVLGHVDHVVKDRDGTVRIVIRYGGVLGLGARIIAVPVDAMVVLGDAMEILDFTPAQLRDFPTYDGAGATALVPDDVIKVGLARPSH